MVFIPKKKKKIIHPAEIYWVTNLDGTFLTYMDTSWVSCYHALTIIESLNKGTISKIVPIDSEVCKQYCSHEDYLEIPNLLNPLIGYDDPYYHNHDPEAEFDEEWFQEKH